MTDTTADVNEEANAFSQLGMQALLDLSNPQPNYKTLLEQGGFVQPTDGMALSFNRANTEFVLRHHELFSSNFAMGWGKRPTADPVERGPAAAR